jgi:hypothetical protein
MLSRSTRSLACVTIALVVATGSTGAATAATPKAGASCSKLGATYKKGATQLRCTTSGKKLVWKSTKVTTKALPQPVVVPKPAPSPTPSTSPTQSATVWSRTGWKKPDSAQQSALQATKIFADHVSVKRTSPTLNFEFEPGTEEIWRTWITRGITLIAETFSYPSLPRPFTAVAGRSKTWVLDTYQRIYKDQRFTDGQAAAFDNSPAFGGDFSNTWNLDFVDKQNLMSNDATGMKQTPGHEFFHVIQANLVGRGAPKDAPQWFWEGPATFIGHQSANHLEFNSYIANGRPAAVARNSGVTATLPLSSIIKNERDSDPYGVGAIATEFLVVNVGMDGLVRVYAEMGRGRTFPDAFATGTGVALVDFYEMFEEVRATLGVARR